MLVYFAKIINFVAKRTFILKKSICKIRDMLIFSIIDDVFHKENINNLSNEYDEEAAEKIVWVFWAQGENHYPTLVKNCIMQMRKVLDDYSVIELNLENLHNYIEIPKYILDKVNNNELTLTQFSDYLRISLLSVHGGIWIDSTVFISNNVNHLIAFEKNLISLPQDDINYSISEGKWAIWFFGSKFKRRYLYKMKLFYDSYWLKNRIAPCYFFTDYLLAYIYKTDMSFKREVEELVAVDFSAYEMVEKRNREITEDDYNKFINQHYVNKLNYKIDYTTRINTISFFAFERKNS